MLPHLNENASEQEIFLHPMNKWHLYSEFENGSYVTSKNLTFLWFMAIIGVFVLILACINFMNLSTARSEKRAKEVGIRKAIGSIRGQLISQFLTESFMVVIFSFVMSVILVKLILPWFNHVAGKELQILWMNPVFWIIGICFVLFTSLLAGSYPAFYLSSFKPLKVLKGTFRAGKSTAIPRKILVVLQFTVSISLIIGTIIIYQQIQFTKNRPVGYARKALLTLPVRSPEFNEKYDALRNSLKNSGLVEEIALANYPITSSKGWNGGFDWPDRDPDIRQSFNTVRVTPEYGRTIGLEFVEGRDFSRELASDKDAIVINESALELMGINNPIGKTITSPALWWPAGKLFTIIGVCKDMVKGSPYESAFPSIIFNHEQNLNEVFIRLNPQMSASAVLPKVQKIFHSHLPFVPFDYKFADDAYNRKFAAEQRIGDLAGFFTILAIMISCMGLFGLASFIAEQRTKEIGIRKVLGASISNLVALMSKEFSILVIVAFAFSAPLTWWMLNIYLERYPIHIEISWWMFVLVGVITLAFALVIVSNQAVRAAQANPVKSLRNE
jgi:ABC-type lipoprotein release transport system permease subunit